ncbi:MAG TPA: S49 family peptidase [Pirellulales bacterium]|nr:S49 family peptidase [Pirellulales bacterium]
MEIDSPGGTTYGVGELSDRIYGLRASGKTVTAVANSMAASAAFWIGSAADRLLVTPGGDVGSVGVWTAHVDESAALDDAGLKVTLISAGPKKTDANPFEPLSDSAKADMQARVDSIYSAFVGTVARNRHTSPADVRENYGQGGLVRAADALKSRMVDGIATFQDAFRSLSVSGDPGRSMTAAESRTANEIMASAGLAPATVAKSAPADDFDDSYFFGSAPRRGTGHGDPNETYRRRLSLIEKQIAWDN